MKSVSIITVNFNQFQVNIDFLKSIKKHPYNGALEIIFVDNGSLEEHEAVYREIFPNLIYIRSEKNLGFAGGNSLGVAVAKNKYLLFLNNDVEISENFIGAMVSKMDINPQIGLLSPLILYFDDPTIIQYAGFSKMNYITCRNKGIGFREVNKQQYASDDRETGYCHGAAMMCRNADLTEVGNMAENYFLYYEELDWCERFRKAGKKIWFIGNTHIYHKESISVGKDSRLKSYFMTRNRMLFIRKNTSLVNTIFFYCYFIAVASLKQVLIYLIKDRKDLAKCILNGILWNFTHSKESSNLGFKTTRL